MDPSGGQYVSRAGLKLAAALQAFGLDVRSAVCADFGCNVGGFTDCLLQAGAAKVLAIDTGYGELAWRLRKDPRVVVMERTNALYCPPPEPVDLVVIDVAWTPQEMVMPAALRWLRRPAQGPCGGRIVSLLKPHYEISRLGGQKFHRILSEQESTGVCLRVCERLAERHCRVDAVMRSTLLGKGGNQEFLLLAGPADATIL